MAKRSDFAQKLLDDLRARKERMTASQSSKGSRTIAGDAYAYTKQTSRGSTEMRTQQNSGFRTGRKHNMPTGANRSISIEEGSNHLVPYGRGRSSEQIGDLSMALAFAFQNGGNLRRMDSSGNNSMLGFLQHIGRTSVDLGKMERGNIDRHYPSTNRLPAISHLHIKEISKGVQKLNQILRACSSGMNFDSYSIEIGKELLKGAIDLEESLRMLVNLQEASEYMVKPQSKSRITLLDEDEDDEDNTVRTGEHKQVARPRFSFDKPSRNSQYIHEVARTDLRKRLMALTYTTEVTALSHDTHSSSNSNSVSHRRSNSNGPNVKSPGTFSDQKNHSSSSKSKPEKGRIPNVIAKLMGLEEVPENEGSNHVKQKESTAKQKTERAIIKKTAEASMSRERKTRDMENLSPSVRKQSQKQPKQIQVIRDKEYTALTEKNRANQHDISPNGKHIQKNVEGMEPIRSSNKTKIKIDKHESSITESNKSTGSRKDIREKEKKQDNTKLREQKGKEKDETKELTQNLELQQMAPSTRKGFEVHLQQKAGMLKAEKRDTNKGLSNNQPNATGDLGLQQSSIVQNFDPWWIKHHAAESRKQSAEWRIQGRKPKGSEATGILPNHKHDTLKLQGKESHTNQLTASNKGPAESFDAMQSKKSPNSGHHEDLVHDTSYTDFNIGMQESENRNSSESPTPRDLKSESKKGQVSSQSAMEEKHVTVRAIQKVKTTKTQKLETSQKINELMTRNCRNSNMARTSKHQNSIVQKQRSCDKLGGPKEAEQVRASRIKESDTIIVKSNISVSSIKQANMLDDSLFQATNSYDPPAEECQSLEEPKNTSPTESCQNAISTYRNDSQGEPDSRAYKFTFPSVDLEPHNGSQKMGTDINYSCRVHNVVTMETQEPLTESESHLMLIMIKSQSFLNTAEALFKLNIPVSILHAEGQDYHNEESKLMLDCGYEIMKRKGKRKELTIHPLSRITITSMKVPSLDELIKELHKNINKLKLYGRNGNSQCVVEDYLPRMLECDVYNTDPDVNCMWDFGWDTVTFALLERDDVIKDVEKQVLNGLLDEITRELLLLF